MAQFASTLYPQTNPTNPILIELRDDWEGDARGGPLWLNLAIADLVADGMSILPEHRGHASRVLERLAALSG